MPVAQYYAWDRAGRPVEPARPIRDLVGRLKATFPRAAAKNLFGWYANDAHYQAVPAQDHTPFSQTGWPAPAPYPVVFATDVMHRPDLGVDCGVLAAYWLAEARAGRMPWLKYLIWQAKIYDVRNGWKAQANSGHHDHIHLSARTDHQHTTLGSWSPLPVTATPPEDPMAALTDADALAMIWRIEALINNRPTVIGGPTAGEANKLAVELAKTTPQIEVDLGELAAVIVAVPAFADAIAAAVADKLAERLAS